jgi:uncharacterized protein YndB with AHSA1/START domain
MDAQTPSPPLTRDVGVSVGDHTLTLTRWIAAPRDRVWRAWTDPSELAQWWGPHGYTNPTVETDVRADGEYRIIMRSPEAVDLPMGGHYLEVEPPHRLVFTDEVTDAPADWQTKLDEHTPSTPPGTPLRILVTVSFEERSGGTLLTIESTFESDEVREAVRRLGAVDGWAQSLEKLDAFVTTA